MISAVHSHVPLIPPADLRQLVHEVRNNGAWPVFNNRASRAEIFRKMGDEEFAQKSEREAGYILSIFMLDQGQA